MGLHVGSVYDFGCGYIQGHWTATEAGGSRQLHIRFLCSFLVVAEDIN